MKPFRLFDDARPYPETARTIVIAVALAALVPNLVDRFLVDPLDPDGLKVFGSYWASGLAWARGFAPSALRGSRAVSDHVATVEAELRW